MQIALPVKTRMNNSDLIVRILENSGVRWVFGIPSGPVLPLIEALRRSSVEFVLTASETSAGFMAATVGSLTGVPGVCVSTVGPGATNLTTGVGAAWLDRSPALAITCNVATRWLDRRVQMRIDHHGLFRPLTKATFSLRAGSVARTISHAIELARTEAPGPVHLDLPEDIAASKTTEEYDRLRPVYPIRGGAPADAGRDSGLPDFSCELAEKLSAALKTARRPLLVTGLTFTRSKKRNSLLRFIERQKLPFVTTLHAKGFLPESHLHWAGVIGRARRSDVKAFVQKADLVLAIGYDPIEINYEEWVGKTPILHVSTESAEESDELSFVWNKACNLDLAIESMAGIDVGSNDWTVEEFTEQRGRLDRALRPPARGFAPHEALDILRNTVPPNGILAYDVGAHTHQIASQWRTDEPATCLSTNGWSSMGYGMPAAFASKLVFPERSVVVVVGDGGFQMTVGELAMARRLKLAVPTIVLNDGWLGLMKIKQERKNYSLSGVYLGDPPESPAHYFGVPCRPANSPAAFGKALEWACGLDGPSVIEAFVDVEAYSATVFD